MNVTIVESLSDLTHEEKTFFNQRGQVEQSLYTSQNFFVVESEKFLNEKQLIMMRKHTRFVDFPLHTHNYVELNYVVQGEMHQTINGQEIHLKQGELVLLNQYIAHDIKASTKEDLIINFIIHPTFFESIYRFLNQGTIIQQFIVDSRFTNEQKGQSLVFRSAEIKQVQSIMGNLLHEMLNPSDFSEPTINLQMGLLLLELTKNIECIEQYKLAREYPLIVEVLNYIEQNYVDASLEYIAYQLNQSYSAMSRFIKQQTEFTFKQLVQEKRLSKACELLCNTTMPITAIALSVGYENYSYFYRIFQQKYNRTPREIRMNFAKKDNK